MMQYWLLIFVLTPTILECLQQDKFGTAERDIGTRIVGGEIARASQFPYAAAIYATSDASTFFCGGAIISNQWILTAAQCIVGATRYTINLGSNNLEGTDPNRVVVATATSVIHPDYNPDTLENDVGLIRLRLPVDFNEYITAIALPQISLSVSATVTAIGWGQENDQSPGLLNSLHFVQLTTSSNAECRLIYGNQITDNMVCVTGQYNEGTCTGDSGSPLIEYRTERAAVHVAISSFMSGQGCESTYPSGYTRTYPYVSWIKNVTEIA